MDKELVSRVIKEINSNDDFVKSIMSLIRQIKYFWLNIGEGLIFQNMNLIMLKWMITKNLHLKKLQM